MVLLSFRVASLVPIRVVLGLWDQHFEELVPPRIVKEVNVKVIYQPLLFEPVLIFPGKQLMTGIANSLRISESTLGHAHSIFRLASNNNFIQGRRIDTVAAVCLYAACRMTSPCRVMLMDFADNRNVRSSFKILIHFLIVFR